jgi:hypothetical protein
MLQNREGCLKHAIELALDECDIGGVGSYKDPAAQQCGNPNHKKTGQKQAS